MSEKASNAQASVTESDAMRIEINTGVGLRGPKGDSYVLTDDDKSEIAAIVAQEGGGVLIKDVKLNDESIVDEDGNVNIPIASRASAGVVRIFPNSGLQVDGDVLYAKKATVQQIKNGTEADAFITPANQDHVVYFGLAKAAGASSPAETDKNALASSRIYSDVVAEAIRNMFGVTEGTVRGYMPSSRVSSLNETKFASDTIVEVIGEPTYIEDVNQYNEYAITDPGWYVFARIASKDGIAVSSATKVTGAAGHILTNGVDYVDVAVRFQVSAVSVPVTIKWKTGVTEKFVFKATDLAVLNLDNRVTYYVHPINDFVSWEYALTTDTVFTEEHYYYRLINDEYVMVPVTDYVVGDEIPADTYYNHSRIIFSGMTPNVTYTFDEIVDCPSTFILPEVNDDGHGVWFEIRLRHNGSYSMTLVPPSDDVKVATEHTQPETKGLNMINLHYATAGGAKVWRFMNTHSSFAVPNPTLEQIAFRKGPDKTEYAIGEDFDMTGAVVVATFDDGSSKIVTPTYNTDDPIFYPPTSDGRQRYEITASYTFDGVTKTATTDLYIVV